MPRTFPPSTTGRCRKPPWIISTCGVLGRVVRLDRLRMRRHEVADRGAVDLAARDRAQHVPLGEHAFERPAPSPSTSTAPTLRSSISFAASPTDVAALTVSRFAAMCSETGGMWAGVYEVGGPTV